MLIMKGMSGTLGLLDGQNAWMIRNDGYPCSLFLSFSVCLSFFFVSLELSLTIPFLFTILTSRFFHFLILRSHSYIFFFFTIFLYKAAPAFLCRWIGKLQSVYEEHDLCLRWQVVSKHC